MSLLFVTCLERSSAEIKSVKEFLLYAGAVFYFVNYITGWLLFLGKLRMGKLQHQILFASIIMILIILVPLMYGSGTAFVMLLISLSMMVLLPIGKKGGAYHIIASTIGLLSFTLIFFV